MSQKVIGIDIGTHTIKVAKIEPKFKGFNLIDTVQMPNNEDGYQQLESYLRRENGFVVAGLESDEVFRKRLELPFIERAKIVKVVPFQLDQRLPFKISDALFDTQITIDKRAKKSTVDAYVVKQEVFENRIKTFQSHNINLRSLIPDSMAYRYLYHLEDNEMPMMIVDIGAKITRLLAFNGADIVVDKTIFLGSGLIDQAIADHFQVDLAQGQQVKEKVRTVAIGTSERSDEVTEIQQIIQKEVKEIASAISLEMRRSHQFPWDQSKTVIMGGGALLKQIDQYLSESLGIKCELSSEKPCFMKAIGYALRETAYVRQYKINYLKGAYALQSGKPLISMSVIYYISLFLISIGLFFGYQFVRYNGLKERMIAIEQNTAKISFELVKKKYLDPAKLFNHLSDETGGVAVILPKMTAFDHLDRISKLLKDNNVTVDVFKLTIGTKKITMSVQLETMGMIDDLVTALQKESCYQNISKGNSNKDRKTGRFKLPITINSAGCNDETN